MCFAAYLSLAVSRILVGIGIGIGRLFALEF